MTLIRNNFGQRRKLTLPSIDITSHQCSPQSTSEGTAWHYLYVLLCAYVRSQIVD
jgi:hypothetical protein